MDLKAKLQLLADAAKYDASCASSGAGKRDSLGRAGIGSTEGMGICHSYTPDGRCVSLLKVLLTNACVYDCLYCINRSSSAVRRARFSVEELVRLTLGFYRRNYVEGLFLSSGIIKSPDYTMEEMLRVVRCLRGQHQFRGYIHLKVIPNADERLVAEAGLLADRLSVNIELPKAESLERLAPRKEIRAIRRSMGSLRGRIEEAAAEPGAPRFASAGQSTQMIVGADDADDATVLRTSADLYNAYRLRRVYYSAFSPIPEPSRLLPPRPAPRRRENRLYQADWLLRFYGFEAGELFERGSGMLPLDIDPKLAWALRHRDRFPLDVNRASREELLRVPGLGVRVVDRILASRRVATLRCADLVRLVASPAKVLPFVVLPDHRPSRVLDSARLGGRLRRTESLQLALPMGHA